MAPRKQQKDKAISEQLISAVAAMGSLKIAITGGIGSGKSYVCQVLAEHGISVYSCDDAAKRLMNESPDIRQALIDVVGPDAYTLDSNQRPTLNKAAMSAFIVSNEANAAKVNAIVHPAVAEDFLASGCQWMECALLFSSGFNKLVNRVICVTAPTNIRIRRIKHRDNIPASKAREWISSQQPQHEVRALSHYELRNDGTTDILAQLNNILDAINKRLTIPLDAINGNNG